MYKPLLSFSLNPPHPPPVILIRVHNHSLVRGKEVQRQRRERISFIESGIGPAVAAAATAVTLFDQSEERVRVVAIILHVQPRREHTPSARVLIWTGRRMIPSLRYRWTAEGGIDKGNGNQVAEQFAAAASCRHPIPTNSSINCAQVVTYQIKGSTGSEG